MKNIKVHLLLMLILFIIFITHDKFGSLSILFGYFVGVISGVVNNPFNNKENNK
jgi:hypothetical protein